MSRVSSALVDSVPKLANGMVLSDPALTVASSSIGSGVAENAMVYMDAVTKRALPLPHQPDQSAQMNFNLQMAYGQSPGLLGPGSGSPEHAYNAGIAYIKRCNGISLGSDDRQEVDLSQREGSRNQITGEAGERWFPQNGQLVSKVTPARGSRPVEHGALDLAQPQRANEVKRLNSMEKRVNTNDTQKQNYNERKTVKILQRPSSVTKNHGPDNVQQGSQDGDMPASTAQKKGRKKTLSLNPEELEDLESLIEQVLKGGFEETVTDSEDEKDEEIKPDFKPASNIGQEKALISKTVTGGSKTLDKMDGTSKLLRNETNNKGRKFVKETGKNAARGKDQGRRRENIKTKENRRTNDFQVRRGNDMSQPSTPAEDDKEKQSTMNIYPAQLKVALKHMESLPPRFQRRLQTGQSQISGSDPMLSRFTEETSPGQNHNMCFMGKDCDKSKDGRERGSRKTIRNLLNELYDDDTGVSASEPVARRLSFTSGGGVSGKTEIAMQDTLSVNTSTKLRLSNSDMNRLPVDPSKSPVIASDAFRIRPQLMFQPKQMEHLYNPNGCYVSGTDAPNLTTELQVPVNNYERDFAQWRRGFDRSATASPLCTTRKTTFSVNAPEFISPLFPTNLSSGNDLRGVNMATGQPESVVPLSFTTAGDQMPSNMVTYRNNMGQPDYTNVSGQPTRYPMIPGMPMPTNRPIGPLYMDAAMAPSNGMIPRQRLVGLNMMAYPPVRMMPHDASARGNTSQQQQPMMMPSFSNQLYLATPPSQMSVDMQAPVTSDVAQMPWYPGAQGPYSNVACSQQPDMGLGSVGSGAPPLMYDGQMGGDGTGGWQSISHVQQLLPFEVGRQKVIRLLNEGNRVLVILTGRVDGNKLSMFSELQLSNSGSFVLSLRNGLCPNNEEKMLETHQWNYKQALEAMEAQKNPIIIDHMFAHQWQMRDYIGLAQMHGYHVEIIDCDETNQFRGIPNMGLYMWDDRRGNIQTLNEENIASGGLNRYHIPPDMNNAYYQPSSSSSSASHVVALGDQASMPTVALPVPNV